MTSPTIQEVAIWAPDGTEVGSFVLPVPVIPMSGRGRTCIFSEKLCAEQITIKGIGCYYGGHWFPKVSPMPMRALGEIVEKSQVPYVGPKVSNPHWEGKFGIFQASYQPYFSDWVGGCGPKEDRVVVSSTDSDFETVCGIEVLKKISIWQDHNAWILKAKPKLQARADDLLKDLVVWIVQSDWCCPWDKNLWADLDTSFRVRDIADWWKEEASTNPIDFQIHKFGTLYSLLYSGFQTSPQTIHRCFGCKDLKDVVLSVARLLRKYRGYNLTKDYDCLVRQYVLPGKLCCQLEFPEDWAWATQIMMKQYEQQTQGKNHADF